MTARARWGTSWRQRLRLAPLYLALRAADRLAPMMRAVSPRATVPWRTGLSIVIPERDAPDMLRAALASLAVALERVAEPVQVIVVANGAPAARYADLQRDFPAVEFVFSEAPLGFGGAVARGLAQVRHDWTYLLNNDMTVDADALAPLLPARGDDVFAIASQIFQKNAEGRREETGFTDWYVGESGVQLFHAPVKDEAAIVPHLCASGGAALFRTEPLARYVRDARCYDPVYWEDVEWGVRAWRDGLRVLCCPASRVDHRHRATTARFFDASELDRIVARNRLLFHARLGVGARDVASLMERICGEPYATQRELSRFGIALGAFRRRLGSRRAPQPLPPPALPGDAGRPLALQPASYSYRLRAAADDRPPRPRMLVVTPFAVYPPRHGGARRVAELLRALAVDFDLVLIADEAQLFDARSLAYVDHLYAIELVQRGRDVPSAAASTLEARMRTHAHPAMVAAVERALLEHRPAVVQIEHAELAGLVALRARGGEARWVLDLHDACTARDFADADEAMRVERDVLAAYDAVTVCSTEDRALVRHPRVVVAGNGSAIPRAGYRPSKGPRLLFIGPFRYAPNLDGVREFLRSAFPAIRAAHAEARLTVLGGDGAPAIAARYPEFAQPGVEVLGHRDDVAALLAASTLSINPLTGIRGSAVKLVESLCAGRVCVSTADAARGFADAGFAGLVVVPDVAAMAPAIVALLDAPDARHRRERPDVRQLAPHQWESSLQPLTALARTLASAPEGGAVNVAANYDRIARFYDVDMARNMPFDDVDFYAQVCAREGGRALELGCGNGRILLALRARGIDAYGIDASQAMLGALQRKAAAMGRTAPVARMALAALALRPGFSVVLCPYSLITYVTDEHDATRLLASVAALLAPGGALVIDAFVPAPVVAQPEFTLDYRRPFGDGALHRYKRIVSLASGHNRIERRYQVHAADGVLQETIDVAEEIRPYSPDALRERLRAAGYAIDTTVWDYDAARSATGARFVTYVARPRHSPARSAQGALAQDVA
jgi:GT2 family glycosyltransferase/SAM-dependent methyltransferase/glycosyltransferase involved in cell wall biosynthesis